MPLWQQSPWSPIVSIVLLSRHSSVQLWGNMAHERTSLSANSFLGWMRTCVYDAWHGAKSAWALFHKPRPQRQQRPGPPTLSPHVCRINLVSEKSLLRNPDSSGPCFSDADRGPESSDTKRLSCNSYGLHRWVEHVRAPEWNDLFLKICPGVWHHVSCTNASTENDWRVAFSPSAALWRLLLVSSILSSFITNKDSRGPEARLSPAQPSAAAASTGVGKPLFQNLAFSDNLTYDTWSGIIDVWFCRSIKVCFLPHPCWWAGDISAL